MCILYIYILYLPCFLLYQFIGCLLIYYIIRRKRFIFIELFTFLNSLVLLFLLLSVLRDLHKLGKALPLNYHKPSIFSNLFFSGLSI
jgi:hypothetical protein